MPSFKKGKTVLLLKICLCMVPCLMWYLYSTIGAWYFMDGEYPYWRQEKDYVHNSEEYNEVVVLGDSVSKAAIRPSLIDNTTVTNLSLGGGTTIEMYYALKTYIEKHGSPKMVIEFFGPVHYVLQDCYITRALYFNYFSSDELNEIRQHAQIIDDDYWNSEGIDDKILRYKFRYPALYLPAVYNSNIVDRYTTNRTLYETVLREKGWMHFGNADGYYDGNHYVTGYENFAVNGLIDEYLRATVEMCEENGIDFILEQSPIESGSVPLIKENVNVQFEEYFDDLQKEYPNIKVVSKLHAYDEALFGDSMHLNESGAAIYTQYIIDTYLN